MTATHRFSVPRGYNKDRIEPANDGVYFALPTERTHVGIWSFQSLQSDPLILTGHRQPITSLCFGFNASPKLLCSAAGDYVIVWNIHSAREKFMKGDRVTGQIIGTTLGEVQFCCFNVDDTLVAACVDNKVFILTSNFQSVIAELEGHNGRITRAEFCPHYTSTLVTISDDRTFKVWDTRMLSLVYESAIITSSSLISLAMNWSDPHVTLGSSDGILRTYDLTDGNNFRSLHQVDISKAVLKQRERIAILKRKSEEKGTMTVTKRGTWKKPNSKDVEVETATEQGQAVLCVCFSYPPTQGETTEVAPQFEKSAANDLLASRPPVLVVVTTGAALQLNAKNLEILDFTDLHNPLSSVGPEGESRCINTADVASIGQSPGAASLWALLGTMFDNELNVVHFRLSDSGLCKKNMDLDSSLTYVISGLMDLEAGEDEHDDSGLRVVAVYSLCEKSPLKSELIPQSKPETPKSKTVKTPGYDKRRKSDQMNQPLTFKPKVKSSGYTQAPRTTMFKPKINKPMKSVLKKTSSENKVFDVEYPLDSAPPTELQDRINVAERPTPVNRVTFSDDGHSVACALANKTASIFKFPIGQNVGRVYVGHNSSVNSVAWNHSGTMVITSSDDKTASIWTRGSSDPLLKFDMISDNMSVNKEQVKADKSNSLFPREVRHGQFFYMDRFVLLTCGSSLHLYKYYLDAARDEIKRYLTKSRYKLVQSWATQSQTITSMTAINAFHSHLVICAGSNRDIEVFDLNQGTLATVIQDTHTRPSHSVCLNKGSSYASQPSSAYNIFASAAATDCIKLWDMRAQRCVQRLEGHLNQAHTCGLALSPCGKYLATGSEDRLVYVFDLRAGTYCDRLRGNTDVVTDVTFHPAQPTLVCGSLDGRVMSFVPG
ncbi:WD repeat-containing protein 27-like [Haliotis cracherodii]|uniref:WD repeat-containing protein 27-like n=1 Tax=Haliotis cracherodii TaxID=6455 RepID=UPI0039EA0C55